MLFFDWGVDLPFLYYIQINTDFWLRPEIFFHQKSDALRGLPLLDVAPHLGFIRHWGSRPFST